MNSDVWNFFQSLQKKPAVVAGHVVSVVTDTATGTQRSARLSIGGNTIEIALDALAPRLAVGDQVRLEQYGQAATAEYRLAGLEAGARPGSGLFQALDDTTLNGAGYAGGDAIFGKLSGGNQFSEYATGRLYHRIGTDVYGIEYPDGSQLFGRAILDGGDWVPDGPNVYITATGVRLRQGETDAIRLGVDGRAYIESDMQVGADSGGRVILGQVEDFDASGTPLGAGDRWGLRVYDESGLPRIALLTGSVDNPKSALFLLGAETDAHYLRYTDGVLLVKGEVRSDTGNIGGFTILADRLQSQNERVQLIAEANDDYGEGIRLLSNRPADTGSILWFDPNNPTWGLGIEYVAYDDTYSGWVKYSHVSTPVDNTAATKHVWVSGGWGGANAKMEFDSSGNLSVPTGVYTERLDKHSAGTALTLHGVTHEYLLAADCVPVTTQAATVSRLRDYASAAAGVAAQILTAANGYEIPISLPVYKLAGAAATTISSLVLIWEKTITGAYWQTILLVKQNPVTGTKETIVTLSNEGQGTAAARYSTLVVSTATEVNPAAEVWYLVVKPTGLSTNGDILIHSVALVLKAE